MAIYRNQTQHYTTVAQSIMRDERLSLKDTGLLVRMLAFPDNWEFSENGLMQIFKNDGQSSIRTGLKHLEEYGYLERRRMRDSEGRILGWEWIIHDNPRLENPSLDNPNLDKPNLENRPQYNTKELNTKELNTKGIINNKEQPKKDKLESIVKHYCENDESLIDLVNDWLKMRKAKRAPNTERAIQSNLEKLNDYAEQSGMTPHQYIDEVIRRGWQAFYVIGGKQHGTHEKPAQPLERGAGWNKVLG